MDFNIPTKLFYFVSLAVNILFILVAAYTLWRIENSGNQSAKAIINAANMTQDALKAFKLWTSELKVTVVHDNQPAAEDGSPFNTSREAQRMLTELQRVSMSIEDMDTQRLQQMLRELDALIHGMSFKEPLGEENQIELNRLREQRERLKSEVEQLKLRLDESAKTIVDLRRENRATFTSGSALETLKQVNERLFAELKTMRNRMLQAEERAAALTAEMDHLHLRTVAETKTTMIEPFSSSLNDSKTLHKRLLVLEADRAKLMDQLQEAQEALSRSLREKAMIEERFLKLDAETA
jgi:chaperonin cofactor prefoldin